MRKIKLENCVERNINGEWGKEKKNNDNDIYVIRTADFLNNGTINYKNVLKRNIDTNKINDKSLQIGDIIVEKSGGTDKNPVGRVVLFEKENFRCLANNFTQVLRIKKDYCYKYIFYQLFYRYKIGKTFQMFNKTTGIQNLQIKMYLKQEINICNREEQEKIANQLDKVQEIIEMRKKQLDEIDKLIKSQFVEMFGDVSKNTKGYELVKLSDIAEYWNGLTYKPTDVAPKGIIVLRSSNIQNGQLDFNDIVKVKCNITDKKMVKDNDILMCSRNGSARLVGKVALINNLEESMSFGAFMMIIRSKYYPYLFTYFQTEDFRAKISTGATTTINQITTNMMNNIKLPLPSMKEINQFESIVKQVDKQKFEIQMSLEETQKLQESLMNKYFGE